MFSLVSAWTRFWIDSRTADDLRLGFGNGLVSGRWKSLLNTLGPRQNDRHFPDDSFKWIFLNENVWIAIEVSLKFVPKGPINNIPTLVQTMAWRRPGDKPLSEPMMVSLLTHICVTRPQWVKLLNMKIAAALLLHRGTWLPLTRFLAKSILLISI